MNKLLIFLVCIISFNVISETVRQAGRINPSVIYYNSEYSSTSELDVFLNKHLNQNVKIEVYVQSNSDNYLSIISIIDKYPNASTTLLKSFTYVNDRDVIVDSSYNTKKCNNVSVSQNISVSGNSSVTVDNFNDLCN